MTDTLWQSFSNALTAVAEAEAVQAAIEAAVLEGGLGNARGMLSIAISFFRPEDRAGDHWSGGRRAKLYIGVAPTNKAWDKASLLVDGSGRSDIAEACDQYRWYRTDAPSAWFFCVALNAIDSREALMREVMRPLALLLSGDDDETAFSASTGILKTPLSLK